MCFILLALASKGKWKLKNPESAKIDELYLQDLHFAQIFLLHGTLTNFLNGFVQLSI